MLFRSIVLVAALCGMLFNPSPASALTETVKKHLIDEAFLAAAIKARFPAPTPDDARAQINEFCAETSAPEICMFYMIACAEHQVKDVLVDEFGDTGMEGLLDLPIEERMPDPNRFWEIDLNERAVLQPLFIRACARERTERWVLRHRFVPEIDHWVYRHISRPAYISFMRTLKIFAGLIGLLAVIAIFLIRRQRRNVQR